MKASEIKVNITAEFKSNLFIADVENYFGSIASDLEYEVNSYNNIFVEDSTGERAVFAASDYIKISLDGNTKESSIEDQFEVTD